MDIYLCGPTVYGPPHLGHGRSTLVYDVLRRYLESIGYDVRHVSNITDIDDKIIEEAVRQNRLLARHHLRVRGRVVDGDGQGTTSSGRPTSPHATEYVEEMVAPDRQLIALDSAYVRRRRRAT